MTETAQTTDERLDALDKRIERVGRDVSYIGWALAAFVASVILAVVLDAFLGPRTEPKPTNHDQTVQDLLSAGVHCYDSAEERAAARQRALAAIDRMQWQADHPPTSDNPDWLPPAPSPAIPSIWDDPSPNGADSWDAKRCFEVHYLP
ncbi:hypothetical protein Mycsm_07217 (plasmid) [Mycobacterium sp. JS623]|uniref:hypothetical protein n=1 Tax=Mycobacterium sp. JS623 TaxID=212767 RepID=UPI0002A59530|nr:hypothetical protein [Mycobacterium sp. JS623]AGB27311.1 hypothetical protein Mycsm_07217 [Mycobacterium sp. JS623]